MSKSTFQENFLIDSQLYEPEFIRKKILSCFPYRRSTRHNGLAGIILDNDLFITANKRLDFDNLIPDFEDLPYLTSSNFYFKVVEGRPGILPPVAITSFSFKDSLYVCTEMFFDGEFYLSEKNLF